MQTPNTLIDCGLCGFKQTKGNKKMNRSILGIFNSFESLMTSSLIETFELPIATLLDFMKFFTVKWIGK